MHVIWILLSSPKFDKTKFQDLRIVVSLTEVCAVPVLLFSMGSVKFHNHYVKNMQVFLAVFLNNVQVRNYMLGAWNFCCEKNTETLLFDVWYTVMC